jgi:hypothetical protein
MTIAPLMMRLRMNDEDGTKPPVTVRLLPTVTLPLLSLVMLFVLPEGWMMDMVLSKLMLHL